VLRRCMSLRWSAGVNGVGGRSMAPTYAVQLSLLDLLLSSPQEPMGGSPDPSGGDVLATIIDLHREPASVAHQWSSGVGGRIRDNIAAIRALRDTEQDSPERTAKLARFSGWGGLGAIFEDPHFSDELAELSLLVGEDGLAHARTSILNAHYTDSGIATAMWKAMLDLGLDRGPVIERL